MSIQYAIGLRDPFGNLTRILDNIASLELTRVVNKVGSLVVTVPDAWDSKRNLSTFDTLSQIDNQIEVWRSVDGGAPLLVGETVWFNRKPARILNDKGQRLIQLNCVDAIEILKRRFIENRVDSGTPDTITGPVDDSMKTIVTAQFLPTTGTRTGRNVGSIFTVQANLGQGASVTHGLGTFWFTNLLDTLSQWADESNTAGTYLAFDVVYTGPGTLEFRTYANQRGNDHTFPSGAAGPVIIDPEVGNLSNVDLDQDYLNEWNFVQIRYADPTQTGGVHVVNVQDATRIGLSAWNLREVERNEGEANSVLREGRPRRTFSGVIVPTPGMQFGRDYNFGDKVTVNYVTTTLNCRLDAIRLTADTGAEQIETVARYDELLS